MKKEKNRKFEKAKKDFKGLSKYQLIEVIYQLQNLVLSIKARNVELERMLEERGELLKKYQQEIDVLSNVNNHINLDKSLEKDNNKMLKELIKGNNKQSWVTKIVNKVKGVFSGRNS